MNKFEVRHGNIYYGKNGFYYEITNCWFTNGKKEGLDYNPIQAKEYFYNEKKKEFILRRQTEVACQDLSEIPNRIEFNKLFS